MESIERILTKIKTNRMLAVRYLLILIGLLVTFFNLYDCIIQRANTYEYIFYVLTLSLFTASLIFFNRVIVIVIVFCTVGFFMLIDPNNGASLNGSVLFFIFAQRIANNVTFSVILFFITALGVVWQHSYTGKTPSDVMNVLLAYYICYLLDYFISGGAKNG